MRKAPSYTPQNKECQVCQTKDKYVEFLESQVKSLQDKLLCLVPEAADREHRLRLTQVANMRPDAFNSIRPDNSDEVDPSDQQVDDYMNMILGQTVR